MTTCVLLKALDGDDVIKGQAVRAAIKSFVPDRETEAKFIALALKGNIKVSEYKC